MRCAFITGITGQDGSYLTELLLEKGYEVHGLVWPPAPLEKSWLATSLGALGTRLFVEEGDILQTDLLRQRLQACQPEEVYHLAGLSHVGASFDKPEATVEVNAIGTLRLLEVVRHLEHRPRLLHASSAEIFGNPAGSPQDESTPVCPINPYGCAKAFASQMVGVYRMAHGLFACNGIFYNHESPRRGENFVTRKICRGAAAIKLGLQPDLRLGDTSVGRDWGDARDYVRGMWLVLQHSTPEDFVFATGQWHRVQEVVEWAFATVELDWRDFVRHDPQLLRPAETRRLVGNAAKAQRLLHWQPTTSLPQLIREMTLLELERLRLTAPGK